MTAPASPGARSGARGVEVHVDRARVDRIWAPIVALNLLPLGVLVTVLLYAATHGVVYVAVLFLPVLALLVFQVATVASIWIGLRRIRVPLELSRVGVVLRTPRGTVSAAWAAVSSVAVEKHLLGRRIRFRIVPVGDPRHAGVVSDVTGRMAKVVHRDGLVYALRILDIDPERLAALVTQQSGRVVTLP